MAMQYFVDSCSSNGLVEYDDEMFRISCDPDTDDFLKFNDNYVGSISLPKNLESIRGMFGHCNIKPGCYFENFDTSKVTDMRFAFFGTKFPEGFSLGSDFDMSKVEKTTRMFYNSKLPDNFDVGEKFDFSKLDDADRLKLENICQIQKHISESSYDKLVKMKNKSDSDDINRENDIKTPGE